MTYKLIATVKDSQNEAPIATCETRLFTVAMATKRVWMKEGFTVSLEDVIDGDIYDDNDARRHAGEPNMRERERIEERAERSRRKEMKNWK